jgi:hypothetical protein
MYLIGHYPTNWYVIVLVIDWSQLRAKLLEPVLRAILRAAPIPS